jgi:exodeoxyribonuclease VII large subunit
MVEQQTLKLSELLIAVKRTIKATFPGTFMVIGEIVDYRGVHQNGHAYFRLTEKDEGRIVAKVDCKIWRDDVLRIMEFEQSTGITFENGITVLLKVRIEYHEQFGMSLVISGIDSSYTLSKLKDERQNNLLRLEREGIIQQISPGRYTSVNKRITLSPVMQRIALISAVGSEGYNDFRKSIEDNHYGYKFHITDYPASMQGNESVRSIIGQLGSIMNDCDHFDVVVIVRGGGAGTWLISFDDFELGKLVANFPFPVVTGIGHESNVSIVDLVANTSTMTPTKAADTLVHHNHEFEEYVLELKERMNAATTDLLFEGKNSLTDLQKQLAVVTAVCFQNERTRIAQLVKDIKNLHPENILSRGYAILSVDDKIVKDLDSAKVGSSFKAVTKLRIIESDITHIKKRDGNTYV